MTVKTYVSLGLGVAVLSGYVITKQDEEMLDIYDLDEYFPKRTVAVLIRKRKYLSTGRFRRSLRQSNRASGLRSSHRPPPYCLRTGTGRRPPPRIPLAL